MITLDFTLQRNSIALRSTNVTLDMSSEICAAASGFKAFSSSATYSPVSCPHRHTVIASDSFWIVVIFNTGAIIQHRETDAY